MNTEPIKILLIDDNPGDVVLVRETLAAQSDINFIFEHGDRLSQGLEKLRNNFFNVILLDLHLPDSKSLDTFIKLKYQVRDTPIIILTGMNNEEMAVQAVRRGAQDYLVKDQINTALLVRSISYAIERSRAEEKRRWLEMKMLYAQKLESLIVLSGGVAHNFNSLLTAIIGNAELAMEKLPEDSVAYPNILRIVSSAQKAAELANQMLAYSGKSRFVVETLNLSRLIGDMNSIVKSIISSKIKMRYSLPESISMIKADIPQIQQMLMNLLLNASEAIGVNKGTIELKVSDIEVDKKWLQESLLEEEISEGSFVCLEISDDGMGISREIMSKIYDPFFTTKFSGRGLGLAAVQGIVRGHGGAILIESNAGEGTKVMVLFPSLRDEPKEPEETRAINDSGIYSILLVEEELDIRSLIKDRLTDRGFRVFIAENESRALEILKNQENGVDLCVLDVPRQISGIPRVIRELKQAAPGLKFLLTSDYGEENNEALLTTFKTSGIIKKPYRWEDLLKSVNQALKTGS